MYSFLNDYSEGAHPQVLQALVETNFKQTVGYGQDEYCQKAREAILKHLKREADIHFLVGGTQTNMTFLSFVLKDYQAVIACDEGHINVHETGAIESTGHKVLYASHQNGKLAVQDIEYIVKKHQDEHMVQPAVVYISQTTELGTYYTKKELFELYQCTRKLNLYLFIDGARLGSALVLDDAPTLAEIAQWCDAFSIGGTKMGALFGEALVIVNQHIQKDFRFQMKQKGAMLAKGRLLGVQFYTLFKDSLYNEIGEHENKMAMLIKTALEKKGYSICFPSTTNQIFVDIPVDDLKRIEKEYQVTHIQDISSEMIRVRFVTSWATCEKEVNRFIEYLG